MSSTRLTRQGVRDLSTLGPRSRKSLQNPLQTKLCFHVAVVEINDDPAEPWVSKSVCSKCGKEMR